MVLCTQGHDPVFLFFYLEMNEIPQGQRFPDFKVNIVILQISLLIIRHLAAASWQLRLTDIVTHETARILE